MPHDGLFTIGDVNKEESILLLMLSAVAFLCAGLIVLSRPQLFFPRSSRDAASTTEGKDGTSDGKPNHDAIEKTLSLHLSHTIQTIRVQLGVLMVTAVTTAISARSLQLKQGLPFATQVIAWACLATCLVFPFVYGFRRAITVKRDQATSAEIMVRQPSSQRLAIVIFRLCSRVRLAFTARRGAFLWLLYGDAARLGKDGRIAARVAF